MANEPSLEERYGDEEYKIWGELSMSDDDEVGRVRMREKHDLELDEPDYMEIGGDLAPCPVDYLCAAVAGCQLSVLRQCLRKARIEEYDIHVEVVHERVPPDEDAEGEGAMPARLLSARVGGVSLAMTLETTEEFEGRARRCLDVAEDACVVGRSVEAGIDVTLEKTLETR